MALSNDLARVNRTIDELAETIAAGLRSGREFSDRDRQTARADIERCVLRLDELRSQLTPNER